MRPWILVRICNLQMSSTAFLKLKNTNFAEESYSGIDFAVCTTVRRTVCVQSSSCRWRVLLFWSGSALACLYIDLFTWQTRSAQESIPSPELSICLHLSHSTVTRLPCPIAPSHILSIIFSILNHLQRVSRLFSEASRTCIE